MSKTNIRALKPAEISLAGIGATSRVLKQPKPVKHEWIDPNYPERLAAHSLTTTTSSLLTLLA